MSSRIFAAFLVALGCGGVSFGLEIKAGDAPGYADLDRGEEVRYVLKSGTSVTVSLVEYSKKSVRLKVDGEDITLACGSFVRPRVVSGASLAVEVTRAWSDRKRWKGFNLKKDVRLFLSDASMPVVSGPAFVYPLRPAPKLVNGNSGGWLAGRRASSKDCHIGLDTYGPMGTEVVSVEAGKVVVVVKDPYQPKGRYAVVQGKRFKSTYIHLAAVTVRPGQQVAAGERLGMMGQSGWVRPHLHLQMSPTGSGADVNPQHYLYDMFDRLDPKPAEPFYRVDVSYVDAAGEPVRYAELFLKLPDGTVLPCDRCRSTAVTAGDYTLVATQTKLGLRGEAKISVAGNTSVRIVLGSAPGEAGPRDGDSTRGFSKE